MDRKQVKREIIRLFASHGSYIWQTDFRQGHDGTQGTIFHHPLRNELIEVWENAIEVIHIFIYKDTTNATRRDSKEIKTIEEFVEAIA